MRFALLTLVCAGALAALAGCSETRANLSAAPPSRPIKTVLITADEAVEKRRFPGVVEPANETSLAFRVGGPLVRFDLRIGQHVARGQVLAEVDPRDYKVKVQRLRAALTEANASLKAMLSGARPEDLASLEAAAAAATSRLTEAQLNFQRYQALYQAEAAPKAALDSAEAGLDTAAAAAKAAAKNLEKGRKGARAEDIEAMHARIEGLEADLAAARNALQDTRITAPFDGIVHEKLVENFETVAAGQPIVSIFDAADPEVTVRVPEALVAAPGRVHRVSCELDLFPGTIFPAVVKEVGTRVQAANQSYPFTVTLAIPAGVEVHPGMAATVVVELHSQQGTAGLFVPLSAVAADTAGHPRVFRFDPASGTALPVAVTTGRIEGDRIEVLEGLEHGDEIVSAGARFLRPGQKVRRLASREGGPAA